MLPRTYRCSPDVPATPDVSQISNANKKTWFVENMEHNHTATINFGCIYVQTQPIWHAVWCSSISGILGWNPIGDILWHFTHISDILSGFRSDILPGILSTTLWNMSSDIYLACHLIFHLAPYPASYLTFYLASHLASHLASYLASCLTFHLASIYDIHHIYINSIYIYITSRHITSHHITLHITLHCIALHCVALHYITLIHTLITLHYVTLRYITLQYIHTYILTVYLALNLDSWRIFEIFWHFSHILSDIKKKTCRARTARKLDTLLGSGEAQGFCGRYINL